MPHHPLRLAATTLGLSLALAATTLPSTASAVLPAGSGNTTISGFPITTKQVRTKQKVYFKVKVNDRTSTPRRVRLQEYASGKWRTRAKRRTNPDGTIRLTWRAPRRAGSTELRVVVPRSGRSGGATTRARSVRITEPAESSGKQSRVDRYEAKVFDLLNLARGEARTCGGEPYPAVGKLRRNRQLDAAARAYAQKMADERFFDHVSPDGSTPTSRAQSEGYRRGVGENIAAGYPTPAAVMRGWVNSPSHCANLMHPAYDDVGIGFALPRLGRSAPFSNYWVQDFG